MKTPDEARIQTADGLRFPWLGDAVALEQLRKVLRNSWHFDPARLAEIRAFTAAVERSDSPVVFAAAHRGNSPTIEYAASALREQGGPVFGVYLFTDPPAATFDQSFSARGSFWAFAEIILRLPETPIYLQAHGKQAFLSQLLLALRPDLRVVQEIYDWMDSFVDRTREQAFIEAGVFTQGEISLMRASESFVRRFTAGFVYKDGGAAMAARVAEAEVPSTRILPCPPAAWIKPPRTVPPRPWRLVHAGQLRSGGQQRRVFGDLHCLPLFRELMAQGCEITAFASFTRTAEATRSFFGDYMAEAHRQYGFFFRPWTPLPALLEELAGRFHFGLLLYDFPEDLAVGKSHLSGAVASKLFTYLAAGLPVLVSEELEAMADLVREAGVGLVVRRGEIATLVERLTDLDYGALIERVEEAQARYRFDDFIPAILDLLRGPGWASDAAVSVAAARI